MKAHLNRRAFLAGAAVAGVGCPSVVSAAAADLQSGSPKKGICSLVQDDRAWLRKVQRTQAKWLYSWGARMPTGLPVDVEFFPMVWGGWPDTMARDFAMISESLANDSVSAVMGFNEPDKEDQANLSVAQVIRLWPQLMQLGVPLVSPGCVHADGEWMQEFMEQVERRNLRVDYVAVHSYEGPSPDILMNRLERIHRTYGRPLWITEFAVGDWHAPSVHKNRHRPDRIAKFMREILPTLDSADFVQRYAWFPASARSASLGTSALFNERGDLTELGKIYRDH